MRPMGFSTGALAKADYATALLWIHETNTNALELSALREDELRGLLDAIENLDLSRYRYKSIHAPKSFARITEAEAVDLLLPFANHGFRIVLHPDSIRDFAAWTRLGPALCIENMDTRKPTGRTPEEMRPIFRQLPDARLCFDIGHARQVDPSMAVAMGFVWEFGDRIEQIHASEVDTQGNHCAMSESCIAAFGILVGRISANVAVILESQVPQSGVGREIDEARKLFGPRTWSGGVASR